jgi:alanine dehydrogenase
MPYILKIAAMGVEKAIQADKSLNMAVNMQQGEARNLHLWSVQKGS